MLSGLVAPSEEDAPVAGYTVRGELGEVRRRVGMPAGGRSVSDADGEEHLALYAAIKGVAREDARDAVDARLEDVGPVETLGARRDAQRACAGGSRAIALVGPSEVVLLDEPGGLDPRSRRHAWRSFAAPPRRGGA